MKTRDLNIVREKPIEQSNLLDKVNLMRDELRTRVLERDDVIDGALIALLTRLNIFLLGFPGTAKSWLTKLLCNAITGAEYFQYLLRKDSKFEEIFGAMALSKLADDRYIYNADRHLPKAVIAFLDEIWKAGSAILNSLLEALNEHTWTNDGINQTMPLQTAFAASNELPEDTGLQALYDRFQLRYEVKYIADEGNFRKLIQSKMTSIKQHNGPLQNTITLDELHQAQQEVEAIDDSKAADILSGLWMRFAQAGISYSDRRWGSMVPVMRASAWLAGRTEVTYEDVNALIALLWDRPEQIREVKKVVLHFANPDLQAALELLDKAQEIHTNAMAMAAMSGKDEATNNKKILTGSEANSKLKVIVSQLNNLFENRRRNEIIDQVKALGRDIVTKLMDV